jgi:hypothetical protein
MAGVLFNDPERLKTLAFIVADARPAFDALITEAKARGFLPSIVSAVRNCAEQGSLAQTKAKRSWHVFGRAVDIELHKGAPKDDPAKFYRELGEWWEQQGGTWGGRWTDLYPNGLPGIAGGAPGDLVHFQWTPAPLTTGVPAELWPKDATCDEVTAKAAAYFASGGRSSASAPSPRPPTGSPATPAPSASDGKKKAELRAGLSFWLWGLLLQRRLRITSLGREGAPLSGEL